MDIAQRRLLHLAELIHQQVKSQAATRRGQVAAAISNVLEVSSRLGHLGRLLAICAGREWNAASTVVGDRIERMLRDLPHYCNEVQKAMAAARPRPAAVHEILADLEQAREEFDGFEYSPSKNTLSVTVGPIVLENIYLGEFEIRLQVASLAQVGRSNAIYRIAALDPHPAGSNNSVMHPHVSDERMCEGEAHAAISAALAAGRIADFFQLVNAVLTTYNRDSPYVALDKWGGRFCHDCGTTMGDDDSHSCHCCEEEFCENCISYCRQCKENTCGGCLDICPACNQRVCPSCLTKCPECGEALCKNCLEESHCPCLEETQPDEEDEDDTTQQPTPVLADGGAHIAACQAAGAHTHTHTHTNTDADVPGIPGPSSPVQGEAA